LRTLRWAGVAYAASLFLHVADHVRRGLEHETTDVLLAGNFSIGLSVAVLVLVAIGHRFAPWAAIALGYSQALGVVAVHALPPWGPFSDSFWIPGIDAWSWAAVTFEIVAAAAFGTAGTYAAAAVRRSGTAAAGSITR